MVQRNVTQILFTPTGKPEHNVSVKSRNMQIGHGAMHRRELHSDAAPPRRVLGARHRAQGCLSMRGSGWPFL